ncbi:hypothetical protein [Bacillus sp. NPDC057893]|uniref:hypothetical protein n=1 Tax=Bacillus sp. NPDC057893 TaxID=3346273 RepID=UPI00366C4035
MWNQFNNQILDETKLWRYMGFTKFLSLIEYGLYFCRADKFEDQFEGSLAVNDQKRWLSHIEDAKRHLDSPEIEEKMEKFKRVIKETTSMDAEEMRKYVVINCWHMNEYESEAMWKLYSQSSEGIAIQSTYGRLKGCLDIEGIKQENWMQNIFMEPVRYIDYNVDTTSDMPDHIAPFLHKRKSFEHEKELRVLISHPAAKTFKQEHVYEQGKIVRVDYEKLIEKIYIAPTLPGWFAILVKDVLKRYGLENIPVVHSTLDEPAIF